MGFYSRKIKELRFSDRERLTIEQQKEVYDALYYLADLMLEKHNPCNIIKKEDKTIDPIFSVTCIRDRRHIGNYSSTCCSSCHHLGAKGCTVKALGCKLFLCNFLISEKRYSVISYGIKSLRVFAWFTNKRLISYYRTKQNTIRNIKLDIKRGDC